MREDVGLAIAAAVVAILGVVYDPKEGKPSITALKRICATREWNLASSFPKLLVLLALIICGLAIAKSAEDDRSRDFMRAAITETLGVTPDVTQTIFQMVPRAVGNSYIARDYSIVSAGMVIFLRRPGKATDAGTERTEEILVLSNSELAKVRADLILKDDPLPELQQDFARDFSFKDYNEDLYARLCALSSASGRQVLLKQPVDCDYDSDRGITLTFNVNNVEQQVNLSVKEIKGFEGNATKTAFGKIHELVRAKVEERIRATAVAKDCPTSDTIPHPEQH